MDEAEDNSFRVTHQVQYLSISQALPGCLPELPSLGTSRKTTVKAPEYLPDLPKLPVPSSAASNKDYDASSLLACEVNKPILFVFWVSAIAEPIGYGWASAQGQAHVLSWTKSTS